MIALLLKFLCKSVVWNCRVLGDQTRAGLERNQDKQNNVYVKLIKTLNLLARLGGFEPPTLGLEMRGFVVTNSTELSRFATLQ